MKSIKYLILALLLIISCTACSIKFENPGVVTPDLPEVTPEVVLEITPEVTPEVILEITPEVTVNITPEVTPEVSSKDTLDVTPSTPTDSQQPSITPVITTKEPEIQNSTVSNNPNSFADKGKWSTFEKPIEFGDVGNVYIHNSVLYNLDESDAIVQLRLVGRLTEEEALQRVKEYNATHDIGQHPEYTEGWSWTGVKVQLDLKNYPVDPNSKYGAIVMTVPNMVVRTKTDGRQPFLGSEDGLKPHLGEYQTIRKDFADFHRTGDILEYEFVFEKPNVKLTEDDLLITILHYYGFEKEDIPQYAYFKIK